MRPWSFSRGPTCLVTCVSLYARQQEREDVSIDDVELATSMLSGGLTVSASSFVFPLMLLTVWLVL